MKLIKRGAEAEIYEKDFFGKRAIVKRRIPKGYRIEELDNRIRAERTRAEARTIHRAKEAGVRTPYIYDIDMQEMSIAMEFMELPRVKEVVEECSDEERERIADSIGRTVGKLHSAGIVHGDLTTSNMLIDG
jgi:TP53 regulating kinase-like protein